MPTRVVQDHSCSARVWKAYEGGQTGVPPMTDDERERMQILCERITTEQDPQEFTELVQQLNVLLDEKDCRLVKNKEDSK
jgi:hypothetical protein